MLVMSQKWTRSEKKEYAIQPCQPHVLLFCKQNWHALCFTFGVVQERPCLPFARFTALLGFGFLGKAPSTKCWHIWTFSQPWFFYWYVRWWLDENYSLLCLLFGRGGPLPLRTASNAAMFSFLMSLLSITFPSRRPWGTISYSTSSLVKLTSCHWLPRLIPVGNYYSRLNVIFESEN